MGAPISAQANAGNLAKCYRDLAKTSGRGKLRRKMGGITWTWSDLVDEPGETSFFEFRGQNFEHGHTGNTSRRYWHRGWEGKLEAYGKNGW